MAEYKANLLKGLFTNAKKCLLSSGENVEKEITKNEISTYESITQYTAVTNMYTVPSDGYVNLNNTASQTASIAVRGKTGSTQINIGFAGGSHAVYVKKGMRVYINGTTSSAYFMPLS